jgi:phosphatidate phosphatase APP1
LVGPQGLSVISDIDDTIKRSEVGNYRAMIANTFLKPFQAVPGMPELYGRIAAGGAAFHYVSGSPWQLYLPLVEFVEARGFPSGSFDLKSFRVKELSTLRGMLQSQRGAKLPPIRRLLGNYPQRRFMMFGDSGEEDPEIYAEAARLHPGQVVGIFIRNVSEARARRSAVSGGDRGERRGGVSVVRGSGGD